ncbi:MAG: endonuclease III [Bacillota bacterium]|nr:endonuclease III [Bacillota bacterium]
MTPESDLQDRLPQLKKQAAAVVNILRRQYPQAVCTLSHEKPWQLLVAAILSAQCTDARVNQITPALFERFPGVADMAAADLEELENLIHSCGLFRSKAKAIRASCRVLHEQYHDRLPDRIDDLTALPGVGRKIANLMLGDAFRIPAIVVDTHCARISRLIGLTDQESPVRIEQDLAAVLDPADWIDYGHLMVEHGRSLCIARRPRCGVCPVAPVCRYAGDQEDAGV